MDHNLYNLLHHKNDAVSSAFMRDLPLKRISSSSAVITRRIYHQYPSTMAEEAKRRENLPPETAEKREKEPVKELPPPPEKPEPGDCCGSGCVRCVWDVYYEELDAYDLVVKQFADSQDKSGETTLKKD